MIESFGDLRTAALLKGYGVSGMLRGLQQPAMIRLQMVDAAETIGDLAATPGARP